MREKNILKRSVVRPPSKGGKLKKRRRAGRPHIPQVGAGGTRHGKKGGLADGRESHTSKERGTEKIGCERAIEGHARADGNRVNLGTRGESEAARSLKGHTV